MHVRSLGYRTNLIFSAFDGEVVDRGSYLVVRIPSNPSFYWGNYLLFERPPEDGDLDRWSALFAEEIGVAPRIAHQAFGWDAVDGRRGAIEPFLRAGFRLETSDVLATRTLRAPPRPAAGVEVRALALDHEWEQSVENMVATRDMQHEESGYRVFARRQKERYRAMAEAGLGHWYGAFIGDRLAADLGIFTSGTLGRYQYVQTHPDFQRRGIAGTLVHAAGVLASATFGLERLVIVAAADSAAGRLYRSVGFEQVEQQIGVGRW